MDKLKSFVIVVDGKPFIKGFDKGKTPDMRADFKFNKKEIKNATNKIRVGRAYR